MLLVCKISLCIIFIIASSFNIGTPFLNFVLRSLKFIQREIFLKFFFNIIYGILFLFKYVYSIN